MEDPGVPQERTAMNQLTGSAGEAGHVLAEWAYTLDTIVLPIVAFGLARTVSN